MRGIRCVLAAVLAAGIVTVVAAQPGRPPGGFGQDTTLLVLTNKALQEELKVTDAQKEDIKAIGDKLKETSEKVGADFKDKFADAKGDKDKTKEVRDSMGKEFAKVAAEAKKALEAKLTDTQKTRLKQIGLQAMGVSAFADPEAKIGGRGGFSDSEKATIKDVASGLKLTDAQKTKIKDVLEEYTKDRDAIRKDVFGDTKGKGAPDPEKMKDFITKADKLTTEAMGKIAAQLDDTQKTAWKGLVGEAFDTSKLRPGPMPKKE
jgi:Spy/CpxP family protein refolding chaperone